MSRSMIFDFETCISEAARCYREGKLAKTRRYLEASLKELARPWQRLLAWVVPGVKVIWTGDPPHHVFKGVSVDRSKPEWSFRGEMPPEGGIKHTIFFHREKGKRYWARYKNKDQETSDKGVK
jgi:hypothetical protein